MIFFSFGTVGIIVHRSNSTTTFSCSTFFSKDELYYHLSRELFLFSVALVDLFGLVSPQLVF
jgi:hypothetical protein